MTFDALTPQEFEELVYDLVGDLGAVERSWRKGTPGRGSAGDSGRDIECRFVRKGPTGELGIERRFVQCKHFKRAVPAEKLHSALAWAEAETPDTLLIVASGFLSNSAKDLVARHQARRPRPFQILLWERPDLEAYLWPRQHLVRKYCLGGPIPELDLLHPLHLEFVTHFDFLSLEVLLDALESLPASDRDTYVWTTAVELLDRPVRLRSTAEEARPHIFGGPADFAEFRGKLLQLRAPDSFIAKALLLEILQQMFSIGNYSHAPEVYRYGQDLAAFLEQRVASGKLDRERADRMRANLVEDLPTIEARLKANHARYRAFCDQVLQKVLEDAERQKRVRLEKGVQDKDLE